MSDDLQIFINAINKRKVEEIPILLEINKVKTLGRRKVAKIIRAEMTISEQFKWCKYWGNSENDISRKLCCALVANCYPKYYDDVLTIMMNLSNDENWGVREEITWAFTELFEKDFKNVYPVFQGWIINESPRVRRAIAVGAQRFGKSRKPQFAEPIFQLIEPLMSDSDEYVRRNLGPFVLGDGLINYYPSVAFEYLEKWATESNEQILWNVAMSFSSTAGFANPHEALQIISKLAQEKSKYVQSAIIKALRRLASKHPLIVHPLLDEWVNDPSRAHIALKILEPKDG